MIYEEIKIDSVHIFANENEIDKELTKDVLLTLLKTDNQKMDLTINGENHLEVTIENIDIKDLINKLVNLL